MSANQVASKELKPSIDVESSQETVGGSSTEYVSLQLRIFKMTLVVTAFSVLFTIIFFDFHAAMSLLVGAFSGILYLRLLAKSIGSLGKESSSVSKFQLLVPVLLILAVIKLPELQLLPALVGFLLYKPSLIIQFLIEPSA
ncbi:MULTISPECIES: ATP synthase subunit I [Prochlorococcus]|uniref:ATP synthase subunit I n=1 Tax=Prochlorococcus TaxID=1218 RepID=UPI0002EA2E90|nr:MULTISPECIES: ATP synthase subunit I [Prochlorococcus]KGG20431.1 hypothetical protein EV08_1015 [Prochlorococcus marinus str. SS2]KGG31643.1 hypothetical protein EV10_1738 [Prochlorococcus marinus str. SS51]